MGDVDDSRTVQEYLSQAKSESRKEKIILADRTLRSASERFSMLDPCLVSVKSGELVLYVLNEYYGISTGDVSKYRSVWDFDAVIGGLSYVYQNEGHVQA